MAEKRNPGALVWRATGEGNAFHANAAGTPRIAADDKRGNALIYRLIPFATTLDPSTLTALGLARARFWGALA